MEPLPSSITLIRTEWPDSLELGRTSRGGTLKIYFNASDLPEAQRRIDNAVRARDYLYEKLAAGGAQG
ncbi:MAG TPA: hypothetical protein PKM50_04450 [Methanoregula sp.]|nr:hypothetical protein [Methanoregula sp.]